MERSDARAIRILGVVLVAAGFWSCGQTSGSDGDGAGAGPEPPSNGAGESNEGGRGDVVTTLGGHAATLGGAGGHPGAGYGGAGYGASGADGGAGGAGGMPDHMLCAGGRRAWWNSATKSCEACPAKPTVQCVEIVNGASYDVPSSTLSLTLPSGRLEVASASLGVTFNYVNHDPEQYADVDAVIAGDTLTFDLSAYRGSGISGFVGEPSVQDTCGDSLDLRAPGFGFGPAIIVDLGAGGAANDPDILCGKTN
jgi:hypothetical protein